MNSENEWNSQNPITNSSNASFITVIDDPFGFSVVAEIKAKFWKKKIK